MVAEWKPPPSFVIKHRMPRKPVISQSPSVGAVGGCFSQGSQGLTHVEGKNIKQTTHLLRNARAAILFRICQDRLSNLVCSVTRGGLDHTGLFSAEYALQSGQEC